MGKGMLGKLKGLFYEAGDEGAESEKKEPEEKKTPPQQPAQVVPQPLSDADKKEADDVYEKLMSSILEGQSLFSQFKKVTASVFETLTDKASGYKAAFAAISGITNATIEDLIKSIDYCISRLANEEQEFQARATTYRQKVGDLKRQLEDIDRQIAVLEEKRKGLNAEILEEVNKIEKAESYFNRAKKRVESELNEERLRVVSFLQGGSKK